VCGGGCCQGGRLSSGRPVTRTSPGRTLCGVSWGMPVRA
jgi:hypothetical protein